MRLWRITRARHQRLDGEGARLPDGWRVIADHPACVAHGDAWLETARTLLRVPSAIVPHESNFLFNPAHAGAASVRVASSEPFAFDPRLFV